MQNVPPPPPFLGVEPPTKFSKKVGLTRSQFLKGVTWKGVGDFFKGGGEGEGCSFYFKNKLKQI